MTGAALTKTQTDNLALEPWCGPAILLVDLDAFFASVEQLDHPAWRGKPVIVGGDADKHGVVSTASYEARSFGVHSAMPSSTARKLCPQAIWTEGHFDRYREMSAQVMAILYDESPLLQQVSIDEAFLDVSPTSVNHEHPYYIAARIQKRVSELGVSCSVGIGTSKTVAKIASDMDKPRGLTIVYPGQELAFLSPLPVRAMSGVGKAAEEKLKRHGIRTLGDMAQAPKSLLKDIYGKNGEMMRNRCLGLDATDVAQDESVKSVSNEITLAEDLNTYEAVEQVIDIVSAKVGRRLRKKGLQGTTVALKIKFSDCTIRSAQVKLQKPTDNEYVLRPVLHKLARDLWKPGMHIRLVGVAVTGFEGSDVVQESLFDLSDLRAADDSTKPSIDEATGARIATATDLVKERFGEQAVFFGREFNLQERTTGTAAKNPTDYLK